MRVWRISNYADLSGLGGLRAGARWHSAGRPIVYAAEHPALALLEILVHLDRSLMPSHYQLLQIELPDAEIGDVADGSRADEAHCRQIGDAWLAGGANLGLRVPSVVAPHSWNYLINPRHPRAGLARIESAERWPFDGRLASDS